MSGPALSGVVVLGTGTDVGKTYVGAQVLAATAGRRELWAGLKPAETGYKAASSDAAALAAAAGHELVTPCFTAPRPVSPHWVARERGLTLRAGELAAWAERAAHVLSRPRFWVETAGGAFSPLSESERMLDVALALPGCSVVLVASNRLGVLHDVLSTLAALASRGVEADAVVLNDVAPDHSSDGNGAELARLIDTPVISMGAPDAALQLLSIAEESWGRRA